MQYIMLENAIHDANNYCRVTMRGSCGRPYTLISKKCTIRQFMIEHKQMCVDHVKCVLTAERGHMKCTHLIRYFLILWPKPLLLCQGISILCPLYL